MRKVSFAVFSAFALTTFLSSFTTADAKEDFGAEVTKTVWTKLDAMPVARSAGRAWVRPDACQALELDYPTMQDVLRLAPLEKEVGDVRNSTFIVTLPLPDGSFSRFRVVESPIMEPGLQAQIPDVHTYLGQGIDDTSATVRFDVTPQGFHSQILSPNNGNSYIDPYTFGDTAAYTAYYKKNLRPTSDWHCLGADEVEHTAQKLAGGSPLLSTGATRREYRLACCATGEYTTYHGGTQALGQAAVVTAINRVTGVYETELAIRFNLVANNINVVYTDPVTDPFNNLNDSTMLTQTINTCNSVIGSGNYDIGHSFGTGGGGVAGLAVVCTASKARGTTGFDPPTGDAFWIDFVAHEMGHQCGGNHCFNGSSTNCGSNRVASTAYEPGSGSTIMGYAGVCANADNLQSNSDAYFHSVSITEITNYMMSGGGSGCGTAFATGNNQPTVNAGADYTIPSGTPFVLKAASSNDPDGDPLTFCWEERDLGPAQQASGAGSGDNGSSPIFRSFFATSDNSRTCPRLSSVIANTLTLKVEKVPVTNRTMTWRCTVRDNRAGAGGSNFDDMLVTVTTAGGAFSVTSPNTAVNWSGTQTVTWAVAGTNGAPVNCANVKISLSTDGGNTFPTVLLASTPNDGSESVTLPNIATTTARIKVEGVGNIFFDMSNTNFTITAVPPNPPIAPSAGGAPVCPGGAVSLSATVGGTEVVDWYTGSCGGSFVGTGNPLNVNPLVTTTYYARARDTINGLSSATCSNITAIVYVPGDANGDGMVNDLDVTPYCNAVLGLGGPPMCALDFDADLDADGKDLELFTDALIP